MNYGIPYKGSKTRLAERICALFPKRKNFYDLFCGGCAMTHYAMTHNLFQRYIANDLSPMPVNTFLKAVNGGFRNETRWISHEEFMKLRNTDEYASICFSFGNNCRSYCYGAKIEPYKKACHYAIVFDDWTLMEDLRPDACGRIRATLSEISDMKQRRKMFFNPCIERLQSLERLERIQGLENIKQLQSLEHLERIQGLENIKQLQSLETLERLETHIGDYRDIKIEPDSVIYCDIPYQGTEGYYKSKFDYDAFFDWCGQQTEPVFISSYEMPSDRFKVVAEFKHLCSIKKDGSHKVTERVFVPKRQYIKSLYQPELLSIT